MSGYGDGVYGGGTYGALANLNAGVRMVLRALGRATQAPGTVLVRQRLSAAKAVRLKTTLEGG